MYDLDKVRGAQTKLERALKYQHLALPNFKKACEIAPDNDRFKKDYLKCKSVISDLEKKIAHCKEILGIETNETIH